MRVAAVVAALVAVVAIAGVPGAGGGRGSTAGYGWPVKPFDSSHPVRGTFGEPRAWFDGAPTWRAIFRERIVLVPPGVVAPSVERIVLRQPGTTATLLPHLVKGRIEIDAEASDRGGGAGMWAAMPTAPERVSWLVETSRDASPVVRGRVAFDARKRLPSNPDFWQVYARGTWQNMPTFRGHRYWRIPGRYLYRLGTLDTRRLEDGTYKVVVTARDATGGVGTRALTFLVWNRAELPPKTPQA